MLQGYLQSYHQTHAMKTSFSPIYLLLELASLQVYPPALARSFYLTSLYDPEINLLPQLGNFMLVIIVQDIQYKE